MKGWFTAGNGHGVQFSMCQGKFQVCLHLCNGLAPGYLFVVITGSTVDIALSDNIEDAVGNGCWRPWQVEWFHNMLFPFLAQEQTTAALCLLLISIAAKFPPKGIKPFLKNRTNTGAAKIAGSELAPVGNIEH